MNIVNYLMGQGGMLILGLVVIVVFIFRKYKEKRYFKAVERRMKAREQRR